MNDETPIPLNAKRWPRHSDNWYVEEFWCDKRLFDVEEIPSGLVYDPHCGMGRVLDAAAERGYFAFGSDIKDRSPKHPLTISSVFDLDFSTLGGPTIVSNPPYSRATGHRIIKHLVSELEHGSVEKVCLLLPATFLWADGRVEWFEQHKPERVWIIAPRPSMPPGEMIELGVPPEGGKTDYAWYVWTVENLMLGADPACRWLRRDGFNNRLFTNQEERA